MILILGASSSGKSRLGRLLSQATGLENIEIDLLYSGDELHLENYEKEIAPILRGRDVIVSGCFDWGHVEYLGAECLIFIETDYRELFNSFRDEPVELTEYHFPAIVPTYYVRAYPSGQHDWLSGICGLDEFFSYSLGIYGLEVR